MTKLIIRIYDECKVSFWSKINGLKNVALQACYDSLSTTKEFIGPTVIIGQFAPPPLKWPMLCRVGVKLYSNQAPNDMKNNITNSFINTVLLM